MRELETRLQIENPRFRRIWVDYSHKSNYQVVITLFPQGHDQYKMIFGKTTDLSYDTINKILVNYLEVSN